MVGRPARAILPGLLLALAALGWAAGGTAHALTLDSAALAARAAEPAAGRVQGWVRETVSARGADGLLRTQVTVADSAGREVARFQVFGGVEGGIAWVIDGAPSFRVGDRVDVALVPGPDGLTVAGEDDAGVARHDPLAGAASGPGPVLAAPPPVSVTSLDPPLAGAVADAPATVTVRGYGFGAVQGTSRVTFQGLFERVDAPVLAWSDSEIVCTVPVPGLKGIPQVLSGPIKVWTEPGGWSDGDEFSGGPRFRVLYQWAGDAWPDAVLPLPVYVNPEGFPWGAGTGPIVADVLAQWDTPGCYSHFTYRGLTQADAGNHADPETPRDARNTVRWRAPWPYPRGWIAVTWSAIDTLTNQRLEADIEVNGERRWTLDPEGNPTAFDLPSTLVHEFGHWLRLGHVQNVASVMTSFISEGERRRQISPADSYGASWIYPTYGVIEAPAGVASGAPVAVRLQALDREGKPRAGVPAGAIELRLVTPDDDTAHTRDGVPPPVMPERDTDADGWTQAVLAGAPDGLYRLEATIDGRLVRPAPLVRVGTPPVPEAPALAFAGVVPQPLAAGQRATLRFTLPQSAHVRLDLYDVRGAHVAPLANARFGAGPHELYFAPVDADGATLRTGVYFVRFSPVAGISFEPLVRRVVVLR